ncbi:DUF421 domain-containing protein [Streptomyces sp. NBC_01794]|uniref:DUF421 domain-containing protein n=1 Tax=Streptomyces sp. NBC_01794 TaxID=2975942 RepID=UPI00308CDD89|nr:DUF421 domain-containing protein [Streptomyces sp. NBC_01794]
MWHDMLALPVPILEKVLRTAFVYALVLLIFRFTGKRGMAAMNTFDFVVLFLLSNVVQNAVIGPDDSVTGGAIGAITLIAMNAALTRWLATDDRAARLLEGTSSPIVEDGRLIPGTLRRLSIRREEMANAVRLHDGDSIDEVQTARLEPSGQLLIVLKPAARGATKGELDQIGERLAAIEQLLSRRPS